MSFLINLIIKILKSEFQRLERKTEKLNKKIEKLKNKKGLFEKKKAQMRVLKDIFIEPKKDIKWEEKESKHSSSEVEKEPKKYSQKIIEYPIYLPRHSKETKEECIELYKSGLSVIEISKKKGIPQQTIYKWITKEGIVRFPRSRYSKETKEECIELYKSGLSVIEISRKKGIPEKTLEKWITKEGIAPPPKYSKETKEECIELYKSGLSVIEISKKKGIPQQTIYKWITKEGIAPPPKYSKETKEECIELYKSGLSVIEISRKKGIPKKTIYNWVKTDEVVSPKKSGAEIKIKIEKDNKIQLSKEETEKKNLSNLLNKKKKDFQLTIDDPTDKFSKWNFPIGSIKERCLYLYFDQKKTCAQIERITGVSFRTIYKWVKEDKYFKKI